MKQLLSVFCLLVLTTGPTFALSCTRPTIEGSYLFHAKAKEQYILVFGKLTNKRNMVRGPDIQGSTGARSENFTATFVGEQATRSGFDRPLNTTVAVSTTCAGSWCGMINTDIPMITFLIVTPYGHRLTEGPCGGNVFYNPDKGQTKRVMQCMLGGVCSPDRK